MSSVTVTVTGVGIQGSITRRLEPSGGQWRTVVDDIPAGANRSFRVEGHDASSTVLYRGEASNVTIVAGQTAAVYIRAQQVTPPPSFGNQAPRITSVTASRVFVVPNEPVDLVSEAHDPDGDAITVAWSATGGAFADASRLSTSWTAPADEGVYTLRLTVTDARGAASHTSFAVTVARRDGSASVVADFNTWPEVTRITLNPSQLEKEGEAATTALVAADGDGDALQYKWTSDCGSFDDPTAQAPIFTLTSVPNGYCEVRVDLLDGRGGSNHGYLKFWAGAGTAVRVPLELFESWSSASEASAGETVSFKVAARNDGSPVEFLWEATVGTLSNEVEDTHSSMTDWTAPSCFAPASVTVFARDDKGHSASRSFTVSSRSPCPCAKEGDVVQLTQWKATAKTSASSVPAQVSKQPFTLTTACQYDAVTVRVQWAQAAEDLDLEVRDASGTLVGSSGDFNTASGKAFEQVVLGTPAPGQYSAEVKSYTNVETAYEGIITATCTTPGGCFSAKLPPPPVPFEKDVRVVVAVLDSAVNPYHDFFYEGGGPYKNGRRPSVPASVLAELGVKPENRVALTRDKATFAENVAADQAFWDRVKPGELYSFEGTNIVAVAYPGSTAADIPRLKPDTRKSAHGVGTTASVLRANPDAIILFVEQGTSIGNEASHQFAFAHPAVDILSTSYGFSIPNTGFPVPEARAFAATYKGVVRLGKLHFSSGGNGPGLTPFRAGAGPWWSIGVSGIEEGSSEGRSTLSGNLPDFVSDFTDNLPYCLNASNCYRNVGGTSFSTPRAAGVASRVLLDARRASQHKGGIERVGNEQLMVKRIDGKRDVSNWFLRRALEQAAWVPGMTEYDPVKGVLDLGGVPVNPLAPWLQVGWGDLTVQDDNHTKEKGVISAALSHMGFGGTARVKAQGFCDFQTEVIQERRTYWNSLAPSIPWVLGGESPAIEPTNPFIYCRSSMSHHPKSNDPGPIP